MIWALIAVAVIGVVAFLATRGSGGSGGLRPGTRGWEAQLTLDPLHKTIASRKAELRMVTDEQRRDRLSREIAFLEQQVPQLEALAAAKDASPGRGSIGFDNLPADK